MYGSTGAHIVWALFIPVFPHLFNVKTERTVTQHFCNFPKSLIWHWHSFHTVTNWLQSCRRKKGPGLKFFLLNSLLRITPLNQYFKHLSSSSYHDKCQSVRAAYWGLTLTTAIHYSVLKIHRLCLVPDSCKVCLSQPNMPSKRASWHKLPGAEMVPNKHKHTLTHTGTLQSVEWYTLTLSLASLSTMSKSNNQHSS